MFIRRSTVLPAVCAVCFYHPANAQVENVHVSPDITLQLSGVVTADEDVAVDDLAGIVIPADIGAIPGAADLSVYHLLDNGDSFLSFDITVELSGPVVAQPSDIVRRSGGAYSIEFDGSAEGIPVGTRVDAVSADAEGDLLMSFGTTVSLSGLTVADEDVVEFDGANFSLLFDGSASGVPVAADLDALHFAAGSGELYLSFDIGGTVDSTTFSDEDILRHDPVGGTWSVAYDGSAEHADWVAGDLDAAFVMFLAGFIFEDGFENF